MRAILLAALLASPAVVRADGLVEGRQTLGYGRLFSNDYIGDGHDRWRAGSYQFSVVRGPEGHEGGPGALGGIIEYRLRSEIISPQTGRGAGGERPYVGLLSFGVHSHSRHGPVEVALGADAVAIGPQTGVSAWQEWAHDTFDLSGPFGTEDELADDVMLAGSAELAWPLRVTERVTVRPYAGAAAGLEDIARLGADVIFGAVGHDDILLRDEVTGHLIRGTEEPITGISVVVGADWSHIGNSALLPEDRGVTPEETRLRARSGVHWQVAPEVSLFYGMTYLSEEFEGQHEGQLLGSLKLNFNY